MTQTERLLQYLFTDTHEWLCVEEDASTVGITDFAQKELGDMIFVELPPTGERVQKGDSLATIESVKAVSDIYSPVTGEVVDTNGSLETNPEQINEDPYGTGWIVKLSLGAPDELQDLVNYVGYKTEVAQEILHVLYVDEAGKLHYLPAIRGDDGQIVIASKSLSSLLTASIISVAKLAKLEVIEEFEELINKPRLREQELQRFFEEHPEFLLGTEYEELFPQVVLKRKDQDDLRPDFILRPLAGVSYEPKIVELKIPGQAVIKPTKRREGVYANIHEAVMQLRRYRQYFKARENRAYVQKVLGFTAYEPRLTLVVGRTIELADSEVKADILESIRPVELVTYEDLLAKYRKLIDELR